eukprot:58235-Chlamydomonas_euryale.AAC.1
MLAEAQQIRDETTRTVTQLSKELSRRSATKQAGPSTIRMANFDHLYGKNGEDLRSWLFIA